MKKKKDSFNPVLKNCHSDLLKIREPVGEFDGQKGKKDEAELSDEQFFFDAMSTVTHLTGEHLRRPHAVGANRTPAHPARDDGREVMTHLVDLVRGSIELDLTFTDEYVEGAVTGLSRNWMKRLKKGAFPVQDHVDLHGLNKLEAEEKVREFLIKSHRMGHRCVLIVHGRGLNSPDSFPVLKESMPVWLRRGPAKKIVLAFASAKPYDGGTGATYVLLRKR